MVNKWQSWDLNPGCSTPEPWMMITSHCYSLWPRRIQGKWSSLNPDTKTILVGQERAQMSLVDLSKGRCLNCNRPKCGRRTIWKDKANHKMSQDFPFLIVRLDKFRSLPTRRPQDSVLGYTHGLDLVTQFRSLAGPSRNSRILWLQRNQHLFLSSTQKSKLGICIFRSILPFRKNRFYK